MRLPERSTLVAPMFLDPYVRGSGSARMRLTITANGIEPARYPPSAQRKAVMAILYNTDRMDTIFIREFRVDAWVGIYEWEKQRAQTLEMEIEIGIPGNEVGRTDNIHDTVHYGEVVERIAKDLAERKFKLLEALAEHVCGVITTDFKAPWVRLSVAKLGHVRNVRKVGVTLERRRDRGE